MSIRTVVIAHGRDRRRLAAEACEALGAERFLPRGGTIGLKPNLVVAKPSSSGATTDPSLAAGVMGYLHDLGWRDFAIMEGSWLGADTREAFRVCGYEEVAREFGARLVDLKREPAEKIGAGGMEIEVARAARAVDALIDLPVLKAHCQTKLTCALKNLKGCIPDREKRRFHALGLHRPIAALACALPVALVVVDAVEGDLTFEEGGNPAAMDRIFAGRDPVLVDACAAEMIGYSPREVDYIDLAAELGAGLADPSLAEIVELGAGSRTLASVAEGGLARSLARRVDARDACSACYSSILHALARMGDGKVRDGGARIRVGQGFRGLSGSGPGVGDCTAGFSPHLAGCPPTARSIREFLEK